MGGEGGGGCYRDGEPAPQTVAGPGRGRGRAAAGVSRPAMITGELLPTQY